MIKLKFPLKAPATQVFVDGIFYRACQRQWPRFGHPEWTPSYVSRIRWYIKQALENKSLEPWNHEWNKANKRVKRYE